MGRIFSVFSRASLIHLDELLDQHREGGLPAFDTVLYRLSAKNSEAISMRPSPLPSRRRTPWLAAVRGPARNKFASLDPSGAQQLDWAQR